MLQSYFSLSLHSEARLCRPPKIIMMITKKQWWAASQAGPGCTANHHCSWRLCPKTSPAAARQVTGGSRGSAWRAAWLRGFLFSVETKLQRVGAFYFLLGWGAIQCDWDGPRAPVSLALSWRRKFFFLIMIIIRGWGACVVLGFLEPGVGFGGRAGWKLPMRSWSWRSRSCAGMWERGAGTTCRAPHPCAGEGGRGAGGGDLRAKEGGGGIKEEEKILRSL